jgi:hypothetical protein
VKSAARVRRNKRLEANEYLGSTKELGWNATEVMAHLKVILVLSCRCQSGRFVPSGPTN